MRRRIWILSLIAAVLLIAVVTVGLRTTKPQQQAAALDEAVVREVMQGEPLASYWFMGGTCRVYEYGDGCLGVLRHDHGEEAVEGRVEFGEKILSAEEYYALYGDKEGDMSYSAEDKAYVDEMGGLYKTRSVPTHVFPYRCFADGEGMLNVWVMGAEDLEVLRDYRGISKSPDDGGHWGALLEPME